MINITQGFAGCSGVKRITSGLSPGRPRRSLPFAAEALAHEAAKFSRNVLPKQNGLIVPSSLRVRA